MHYSKGWWWWWAGGILPFPIAKGFALQCIMYALVFVYFQPTKIALSSPPMTFQAEAACLLHVRRAVGCRLECRAQLCFPALLYTLVVTQSTLMLAGDFLSFHGWILTLRLDDQGHLRERGSGWEIIVGSQEAWFTYPRPTWKVSFCSSYCNQALDGQVTTGDGDRCKDRT